MAVIGGAALSSGLDGVIPGVVGYSRNPALVPSFVPGCVHAGQDSFTVVAAGAEVLTRVAAGRASFTNVDAGRESFTNVDAGAESFTTVEAGVETCD